MLWCWSRSSSTRRPRDSPRASSSSSPLPASTTRCRSGRADGLGASPYPGVMGSESVSVLDSYDSANVVVVVGVDDDAVAASALRQEAVTYSHQTLTTICSVLF